MTTLKQHAETNRIQWKRIERDLSEILASHGEKPIYQCRLNKIRADYRPTEAEEKALYEYIGITDFRDDPSLPFRQKRNKVM